MIYWRRWPKLVMPLELLGLKIMLEDQAIAEIREVRRLISEECDHDPRKLINYYKELQLRHNERLMRSKEGKEVADESH